MKRFAFFVLMGWFCFLAQGQTVMPPEYPYNPDSDGDEFVAVSDVLMSVASYDNDFQASPIMVDSLTIEQAMQLMLQKLDSLLAGSSVANPGDDGNPGADPDENTDTSDSTWTCGDPVMYWGFEYGTYAFEDQCWFQDNLRTLQYSNGDSLTVLDNTSPGEDLTVVTEGAAFISNLIENEVLSVNALGRMYNWFAVADARNLCPSGWHVPVNAEWETLSNAISQGTFDQVELLVDGTYYGNGELPFSNDGFLFTPTGLFTSNISVATYFGAIYWSATSLGGNATMALEVYASSNFMNVYPFQAEIFNGTGVRCVLD